MQGTPAFLLHKPATVDGMTATDVVFPAFLFIAGMWNHAQLWHPHAPLMEVL